ncbi:MAG: hypothetical protein PVI51_07450 [candidate division WOR-3 bacterium]
MNTISILAIPVLFTILLPTQTSTTVVDTVTLNRIRVGFYVAVEDEDTTQALMTFIRDEFSDDHHQYPAVILAYYAALEGLRGRHSSNPLSKFVHVSNAVEKMNEAVEKEPRLLEGRFLRFSFFHQIPGIFGVRDRVAVDLKETIEILEKRNYEFVDERQQQDMIGYLLGTDEPDAEQRSRLEQLVEEQPSTP